MQENPYQTPMTHTKRCDDGEQTLLKSIRTFRNAQRRWSHRCWLFGFVGIVVGAAGINLSQMLHVNRSADWLATAVGVIAIGAIVIGCGLIVLGPISWFWIRKSRCISKY
jgi:hypothetical protein